MRIVCVSDTHNAAPGEGFALAKGDILIHAGDLTNQGSHSELQKAIKWLAATDFAVKIVVAGQSLLLEAPRRLLALTQAQATTTYHWMPTMP